MKNISYLMIILLLFLFSSCLKPVESKFKINVEISFSSQTKTIMNKDINEAKGEVILRLDSPLANIGQAHLNIVSTTNNKNIRTIELKSINENTFSGNFELTEPGKYEIEGVFSIGGENYTSKNKLYINVYDYKKELEPILKFKNTETGKILENNIYDPYKNYSILVDVDSDIVYNSDFSYKIYFDNKLVENGNIKNKTFESTPLFFQKKKHIISVEIYDTANNGFGRTTVELNPKNIDTSFNLITELHKESYDGPIITDNATLSTIDPIYVILNVDEKYSLPASYLFSISNNDKKIVESTTEKKELKYGPIYLNDGEVSLLLNARNMVTNDSTQNKILLHVEKFEEFSANVDIYKKDYLDKNIKIDNSSIITNRDPVFFNVSVKKKRNFSDELKYSFTLKKDNTDYKKLDITTNSTILETEKMYLDPGNYELTVTITKENPEYTKTYYKTFKVSKAINNFDLKYSLNQKNSDNSTTLYILPEKIEVDPESTRLNDFDIIFNINSNYSYPATYVYSININDNELFKSNPVQVRTFTYNLSDGFPLGHNYIQLSTKDIDNNYSVTKNFEVLVKENNPPELYRISIEGTDVYSKESTYDFYDLNVSKSIENPRILIEFSDESEIEKKDYLSINIKILENGTNKTFNIPLSAKQKNKFIKYDGILKDITLDSTQTWEIQIDPSQIVDEFGNTYADEFENIYYTINFKTK
ncbi:hypothetical protein [Marinitoga aeolica]|uniref:Cadherin domain-containing protein n=1 Tax=Marinitoga aeolica TaxID=2809031 RepID=A0ABY8PN27_9BACT|nr:hypothetical protein [Marinitoga aeolica]WGS64036.1 hypothetical protein JRV97_06540 [Marinitoga aeolica]